MSCWSGQNRELPKSVAVLVCRKHSLADSVRLLFEMFAPAEHPLDGEKGLVAHAIIGEGTKYGEGTVIGRAVIGKNCSLGKNCRIAAGVYIADDVVMGDDCVIWPNVIVYSRTRMGNRVAVHAGSVLGGDGFGYTDATAGKERIKKPHLGRLVIEDDVEIGSNCCLDRALLSETRIGEKNQDRQPGTYWSQCHDWQACHHLCSGRVCRFHAYRRRHGDRRSGRFCRSHPCGQTQLYLRCQCGHW